VDNPYCLPCDDDEIDRLDELHYVVKATYGWNVLAPISPKANKIIDVGTGSGTFVLGSIRNSQKVGGQLKLQIHILKLG